MGGHLGVQGWPKGRRGPPLEVCLGSCRCVSQLPDQGMDVRGCRQGCLWTGVRVLKGLERGEDDKQYRCTHTCEPREGALVGEGAGLPVPAGETVMGTRGYCPWVLGKNSLFPAP